MLHCAVRLCSRKVLRWDDKPIPTEQYTPNPGAKIKLVEDSIVLHRVEKELPANQIAFKCDPKLTRPEIKQYLEKIYGLNIVSIKTLNRVGKVRLDQENGSKLTREV